MLTVVVGRPPGGDAADGEETRGASASRPCRRIPSTILGRKWVGTDTRRTRFKFESAHWIAIFVCADPNGRGRMKWVVPLKLLLLILYIKKN